MHTIRSTPTTKVRAELAWDIDTWIRAQLGCHELAELDRIRRDAVACLRASVTTALAPWRIDHGEPTAHAMHGVLSSSIWAC